MKLNKIFMLGTLVSAALFTACSDDDDNKYEWAKPAGNTNVTFISDEHMTLDFTATSFDVELYRPDSTAQQALTVPITVIEKPDFVTVPSEATFAAGDSVTKITVTIGEGMEAFKDYTLSIKLPNELTNPWANQAGTPIQSIKFLKEDFQLYATGTFHETVYYEDAWDVEIQYSALLDLYRIPNAVIDGTHWYFHWNGPDAEEQEFYFTDSEGKKAKCEVGGTSYHGWFSGIVNKTYGNVYVTVIDGNFYGYDGEAETGPEFDFPVTYRVSEGTFGSAYEYIDNLQFVK